MDRKTFNDQGQAVAEMIVILPVLIILASIATGVAYMCWQGIKVQEAANYAARLEGQERVAGGSSTDSINHVNGVGSGQVGDTNVDPTLGLDITDGDRRKPNEQTVYGRYYKIVRGMFSTDENQHLVVPPPVQGTEIDQIKVIRVINWPTIFGFKIPQVTLTGTAYGGEDSNAYALPRWGCTGPGNNSGCSQGSQYWAQRDVLHGDPSKETNSPIAVNK